MNELVKIENGQVVVDQNSINKIIEFKKYQKEIEYQEKLLKEGLMEAMQKLQMTKFIVEGLSATIKAGTTRTAVDSKRLKEELPDIYEEYSKTTVVSPSITISVTE